MEPLRALCCIASNRTIESISRRLEFFGVADMFSGRIFSAELVERTKPAQDIHLAIMGSCSVPPGDCFFAEDSPRAGEADVRLVPVSWLCVWPRGTSYLVGGRYHRRRPQ
ncbi:HAD hydrolase-like protein [Nocardiopsis alborubida]|uniref:HAD hydrolase-like protein n=1 Tax=Nocardiopsis alborubida TaxID=146802 RepID=UPI00350E46BF